MDFFKTIFIRIQDDRLSQNLNMWKKFYFSFKSEADIF
jgi:hypothetical protein